MVEIGIRDVSSPSHSRLDKSDLNIILVSGSAFFPLFSWHRLNHCSYSIEVSDLLCSLAVRELAKTRLFSDLHTRWMLIFFQTTPH